MSQKRISANKTISHTNLEASEKITLPILPIVQNNDVSNGLLQWIDKNWTSAPCHPYKKFDLLCDKIEKNDDFNPKEAIKTLCLVLKPLQKSVQIIESKVDQVQKELTKLEEVTEGTPSVKKVEESLSKIKQDMNQIYQIKPEIKEALSSFKNSFAVSLSSLDQNIKELNRIDQNVSNLEEKIDKSTPIMENLTIETQNLVLKNARRSVIIHNVDLHPLASDFEDKHLTSIILNELLETLKISPKISDFFRFRPRNPEIKKSVPIKVTFLTYLEKQNFLRSLQKLRGTKFHSAKVAHFIPHSMRQTYQHYDKIAYDFRQLTHGKTKIIPVGNNFIVLGRKKNELKFSNIFAPLPNL